MQTHPSPVLGLMRHARQSSCAILKPKLSFHDTMAITERGPTSPFLPHLASGCLLLLSLLQLWHLLNPGVRPFRDLNQQKANSVGGKRKKKKEKNYLPELFT